MSRRNWKQLRKLLLTEALFIGSLSLIALYGSWQVAVGVVLFGWAMNRENS